MPLALPFSSRACRLLIALAFALGVAAAPAIAAETGQTYYAHGAQVAYSGIMPAPGKTQFYGYSLFYDAATLRDGQGDRVPGVSAQAFALAPRVLYTFEQPWQGFKVSVGGFSQAISSGLRTPAGDAFDNGVTLFGPEAYLSRSFGDIHVMAGLIAYLPWGNYDPNAAVNVMLNRYGGAINSAVTWIPSTRWELSLTLGHEFKGRNRDTQYRDGQQSGLTYGIAHRPLENMRWDFGISGHYTVQIEDDRLSGVTVADRRIRKFSIGPKVGYSVTPTTTVVLQWHKEYEVRNAPRGDLYWLLFTFPLGS